MNIKIKKRLARLSIFGFKGLLFAFVSAKRISYRASPKVFFDELSFFLVLLTLVIVNLCLVRGYRYFSRSKGFLGVNLVIFCVTSLLIFFRKKIFFFFVFFEFSLVPTLFMIFLWGKQPERLQAVVYFMVYRLLGAIPLFVKVLGLQYKEKINFFLDFFFVREVSSVSG